MTDTLEEQLANMKEAIREYLDARRDYESYDYSYKQYKGAVRNNMRNKARKRFETALDRIQRLSTKP
jgi:hypothetical protein